MKTFNSLLLVCLFFVSATILNAQILAWDFNGNTGSEAMVSPTTTNSNLNNSVLSRGSGINPNTLANSFSSTTFNSTTFNDAVLSEEYLQFTISTQSGYQLSLTSLDVNFRRSGTGPDMFQWQFSLDGFTTAGTNFGGAITFTDTSTNGVAQTRIDLSGITQLQNIPFPNVVTFRLFGWNASSAAGTFALGRLAGNDLAVGGMISPVLSSVTNVGGRVIDAKGNGIQKVSVKLTGGQLTAPLYAVTNPFGFYKFEVPVWQTYFLTVSAKNYVFSNPTRVITVNDEVTDVIFVADPR